MKGALYLLFLFGAMKTKELQNYRGCLIEMWRQSLVLVFLKGFRCDQKRKSTVFSFLPSFF